MFAMVDQILSWLDDRLLRQELDAADRTYLNTGMWSDLIPWPALGSDADAKTFIDQLAANAVPAQRRLTWALVDASSDGIWQVPASAR